MAKAYLTDDYIRTRPRPPKGSEIDYDNGPGSVPGFAVRFTPTGQPTFLFCYYTPGAGGKQKRRMVLGEWRDARGSKRSSTVQGWRDEAAQHRLDVKKGRDPYRERQDAEAEREAERRERERLAAEAEAARKAEEARLAFDQLCDLYLDPEHGAGLRPDTMRRTARRIARHLRPKLGERKADEVTTEHIKAVIKPLRKAGKRCEVVHVVTLVSGVYSWAMREKVIQVPDNVNPAAGILLELEQAGEMPDPKERALWKASEYRALWHVTNPAADVSPAGPMHADIADCLRLILFTGARPGEAAGLRWAEVDLEARVWNKPRQGEGRSKSKRGDTLPLVDAAMAILRARADNGSDYVFPSGRKRDDGSDGCLTANRLATGLRGVMPYMAKQGVEPFTPHDVRRTVATGMGEIGVSDEVVELTLNHALPKLKKTYDLSRKVRIRRRAMEAWVGYFMKVVTDGRTIDDYEDGEMPYTDNVVQFPMRMGGR